MRLNWRHVAIGGGIALGVIGAARLEARDLKATEPLVHSGMCDASAGVPLGDDFFAVANDEDNTLRVYRNDRSGPPMRGVDLTTFLHVNPKSPETDLEGAARVGDRIYWITSHGRNQRGRERASRERFFATDIRGQHDQFELVAVGRPYQDLLLDLIADPRLARFHLARASGLAPKERGALNIEGLCATADHKLLIGFRNPIPGGQALIVPLENPDDVVRGARARLGNPILLDLDGLGIRDLAWARGKYYLIAGSYTGGGRSQLYEWDGSAADPRRLSRPKLRGLNPEALVFYPDREEFLVLNDDGTRLVDGRPCKTVKDPARRSFRSVWLEFKPGRDP
jgi:hypothetical protein